MLENVLCQIVKVQRARFFNREMRRFIVAGENSKHECRNHTWGEMNDVCVRKEQVFRTSQMAELEEEAVYWILLITFLEFTYGDVQNTVQRSNP